jgi:hypothetical protein
LDDPILTDSASFGLPVLVVVSGYQLLLRNRHLRCPTRTKKGLQKKEKDPEVGQRCFTIIFHHDANPTVRSHFGSFALAE